MNANLKMLVQFLITSEIIGLLIWLLSMVVGHPDITPPVRDVLTTVLYQIVPLVTAALGFWLGTSLSSASKDQTILNATKVNP